MNLSQEAGESESDLLFINFNQDGTSLSVGLKTGYKLFPLTPLDRLEPSFEKEGGEVCIIERLFSSSLVALVEMTNPRKLRVCHFKKNSEICTYSYPDTILTVKLNRQRLIVVLRQNLYIHNIRDMKVMHTIRDTPKNPSGLCALSVDNDNGFIAYPGSNQNGEVQVFDAVNLKAVAVIAAHDSPLAALTFNSTGTKLASASTTGTVIRVFSVPQGEKLLEFRRGMKRFIQINCLSFSTDDMYLVSSSSTETVHVFRLADPPQEKSTEEHQGWMSYIGRALATPASMLPAQVTDAFTQSRAFAQLKLPRSGLKNVCTVASIDGIHRILVATSDGALYMGNIDPREGGECRINKEFRLFSATTPEEEKVGVGLVGQQRTYATVTSSPPTEALASEQQRTGGGAGGGMAAHSPPNQSHHTEEDDDRPPAAQSVHS